MKISKISIVLSVIGIAVAIWVQYELYDGYKYATGKTRALYGLKHLSYLDNIIFGCSALMLSIVSMFMKEKWRTIVVTFSLASVSILLLTLSIWSYFI